MDEVQEFEWLEAQKIVVSIDLKAAAKKQLQFLAAVDRNRCLYDGPILNRAIYRYKNCWLPLLAKHAESEVPLVVPLDCEWIWHCHRLNPVQYKTDCEKFYGRILGNRNVVSVVEGTSKQKTAEIWSSLYPEEPYELAFNITFSEGGAEKFSESVENIKYDLVSAVRRQSVFFYQVSRPSMHDDCFLEGAVARYKGFLHLIKRNAERSVKRFCVPTYDIDLIWHSHQLQPVSYCKDLVEALGKVLEHDDTDSDRTEGKKLDTGFSGTTKQWEETFGRRYWRAGAMYRGSAPSPVTVDPWPMNGVGKNVIPCTEYQKYLQLPQKKVVEVLLEIVDKKNLPAGHKGSLSVIFSKSQPDSFFKTRRVLNISSESGQKQVAAFQCEPTEKLVFALMSRSPSHLPISRAPKTMGTTSISLQDLLEPISKLSVDKWFELAPSSGRVDSKPISLHIAASFTVPTIAPLVFHMVRTSSFSVNNCFFPLPGRVQPLRGWTCVVDDAGNELMSIQMRNSEKTGARNNHISKREVVGVIGWPGETHMLAESIGTGWALLDSSLHLEKKSSQDGHIFELRGYQMVKLFRGRKLDYEPRCCHQEKPEQDFMTAVRFSTGDPYGKAVALFNLKSGLIKVNEEWFAMPSIVLSFILSDMLRKEGYNGFVAAGEESFKEMAGLDEEANGSNIEGKDLHDSDSATEVAVAEKGSGCGVGCGSGCGNDIKSSGCNRHVSGNGNDIKSSGCGGCGVVSGDDIKTADSVVIAGGNGGCSDCGVDNTSSSSMVRSGGCGGCGAGYGNDIKSAGGMVINAGSGNGIKSSGCGGCGVVSGDYIKKAKPEVVSGGCSDCGVDITSSGSVGGVYGAGYGNDIKSAGSIVISGGCSDCGVDITKSDSAVRSGECGSGCGQCGVDIVSSDSAVRSGECGSGCGQCGVDIVSSDSAVRSGERGSGCGQCGVQSGGCSGCGGGGGCGGGCGGGGGCRNGLAMSKNANSGTLCIEP